MEGTISSSSGNEKKITFAIRALTPQERKKNAMKGLGLCWGLSVLSAPLPPIHWVTVPGLFFFGIYWFFRKLNEGEHFEETAFPCPECGGEVKIAAGQVAQNPLAFVCPNCRYGLKLSWKSATT